VSRRRLEEELVILEERQRRLVQCSQLVLVLQKSQFVSEECPTFSVVQWDLVRLFSICAINLLLRNG
jgi:hypothetical protein